MRLREVREEKQVTVTDLAKAADVSQVTIWRLETGRRAGSMDIWARIAAALDVSIADLLDEEKAVS